MVLTTSSTRAFRTEDTTDMPVFAACAGFRGAVASHHYQSALAANEIMRVGGNAVDAGVAAVLVEGVVNPHMHGPAGECPILIGVPGCEPVAINGNTMAPKRATPQAFFDRGLTTMPDKGILAAGVPSSLSALLMALQHYGSLPFHTLVQPALSLASEGFAMHSGLLLQEKVGVAMLAEQFKNDWRSSAAIYLPDGKLPQAGQRICNPALASVYAELAAVSRRHLTASAGWQAVRHEFYNGSVADVVDRYSRAQEGLLRADDFAALTTPIEKALSVSMDGTSIYKCDSWCQGPALLQTLQILKQCNLEGIEHNSTEYLHLLAEASKLAYADREQYYADPSQVDVPMEALLSEEYATQRAALVNLAHAGGAMRPGDPVANVAELNASRHLGGSAWGDGTVHVDVVDQTGLMASFTPSGGWLGSHEVIGELGFPLGNRGMTFYLSPEHHPNVVAPHKRPRTTISPSMVTRDGEPWIAFGTMGGDQQDQWMLQFYLNVVLFDMTLTQAIEAPKISSENFNGFFSPHDRFPGRLRVEESVGNAVLEGLAALGHEVDAAPMWTEGYLNAVSYDAETSQLQAAADPRGARGNVFPGTALAW